VTHLTADLLEFLDRWLPAPPARLLEIGCGDGALTRTLADHGYRVTGVDPEAPTGEPFVRASIEEFTADQPFDAAVAIRSLHHVGDLGRAIERISASLERGGRLVMHEFAAERIDERVQRWLADLELDPRLGRRHDDVIPLATVRAALGERFIELAEEPVGYLALEAEREDLDEREQAAIAEGALPALGIRLAFELRG
jgi:SAM-dependent methyltransferase